MRYLQEVHKMKAQRNGRVPVRVFLLQTIRRIVMKFGTGESTLHYTTLPTEFHFDPCTPEIKLKYNGIKCS